jgi:hypothetical protein
MRNDSELVLLFVLVVSGLSWFIFKAVYLVAAWMVREMLRKVDEHPLDWHQQAPPTCRGCGYDLRGSPEHCPECGRPLDPVDSTIVRYMISLGPRPVGQAPETGRWSFRARPGRRGELKLKVK